MKSDTEAIRAFVMDLLARKGESEPVADDAPLITSGRLDSIDVLEIVSFLEARYAVDFSTRPFDPGDFDTIASIAQRAAADRA